MERGGVDWIELAQVRDKWRARVDAVMNIGQCEEKEPLGTLDKVLAY